MVDVLRGLGKSQIKDRKKTENKIKSLLKCVASGRVLYVNEMIRETNLDPTAVVKAVNRLVKNGDLISYTHKNKKYVAWPTAIHRNYFQMFKDEDEKRRRSDAQKEIIFDKLLGKAPKESKEYRTFLEKNTLDLEVYKVNDQLSNAYYENDKDKWLKLYEKYDRLCIKLLQLHGISSKPTPMERKLKQFKFGLVTIPAAVKPIGSEISLTLIGDTPSPFHKNSNQK